eukprot:TRINITY_DN5426_c0_g1_i1.p1 TRINITY_DN5426_c0_g1~~TRINITY_DN5426_c0_g1_i1.p1  ORF type:complete len:375 (+),score=65.70 TRINITY_DN5426_c0_g1_i1:59-1126(+)
MYHLHHVGKASPDPSCYVFQLAASPAGDRIAASNSNHTVKLYARADLRFLGECAAAHTSTIRDICWSPTSNDCLFSCDGSGAVYLTDTRKPESTRLELALEHPDMLFSMSLRSCGNLLALGDGLDTVLFDLRKTDECIRRVSEFHTDDITQVRFHPTQPDVLCTASEDGLINILDLTKPDNEDDDFLKWVFNAENPVTKIAFFGPRQEHVAGITTLEGIVLASLDTGDVSAIIPRQAEDRYIVDCSYGRANGRDDLLVFAGSKEPAFLGSVMIQTPQSPTRTLSPPVAMLPKGHTDLVRAVLCLDGGATLVTAGEDGLVCLWRPDAPAVAPNRAVREHPSSSTGPQGKNGKFRPY